MRNLKSWMNSLPPRFSPGSGDEVLVSVGSRAFFGGGAAVEVSSRGRLLVESLEAALKKKHRRKEIEEKKEQYGAGEAGTLTQVLAVELQSTKWPPSD